MAPKENAVTPAVASPGDAIAVGESNEEEKPPEELVKEDPKTMPIQQYLETTVVPLLFEGCRLIATERPPDPVATLAKFLLERDPTTPENIAKAAKEAEEKANFEAEKAAGEANEKKLEKKKSVKK